MPVKSTIPDIPIEDIPLDEFLSRNLEKYSNRIALIDGDTGEEWSFRRFQNASVNFGAGLQTKLGLKHAQVMLFYLPNSPLYAVAMMSCLKIGVIVSGCNPIYTPEEVCRQIIDADASVILTDVDGQAVARKAIDMSNKKNIRIVIVEHKGKPMLPYEHTIESIIEVGSKHSIQKIKQDTSDTCFIPYSSGTSGVPKGVMLSHYNIITSLQIASNKEVYIFPDPGDHIIAMLPFFHIFGLIVLMGSLKEGVTAVTMRKFEPKHYLGFIQQYKVKALYVVPPIVVLLAKNKMVDDFNLSTVESLFCGAAPLGENLSREVVQKHPSIKYIMQGYGMTETTGISTMTPPMPLDKLPFASCGKLVSNSGAKVINPDSGEELGVNQRGEICLSGPGRMKGYLNKQKQTDEMIDRDGWVHTGDIGYYDEEGFFYIVDRLKELIKVKGFQVAPAELEDHLLELSCVADAAVIGLEDERSGEVPVAFIVKKEGSQATQMDIMKPINDRVAHYKRIHKVYFIDELPKSAAGKILRRILRDQLKVKQSKL